MIKHITETNEQTEILSVGIIFERTKRVYLDCVEDLPVNWDLLVR